MQPTELCRICGGTGLFLPVFDPECKYFEDIESCLSVRVKRNDALSQVVCHKCVGTLSWCKDFVGKVNHVKKSRFEPSSKLCFSCRTADGPLFPLPKPSAEKLQDFFSLNAQKGKVLKICHECQFALDCINDLREKANTAQQLSRRGQHLQFQVLRKSPSVEDLLSSLKNREVEVDLGSRNSRSTRGPKQPSSPANDEGSPHSKQQNGISNRKSVEDNKMRRKSGVKNSGDSDTEMSVVLLKLGEKSEKDGEKNSKSPDTKTTKKKEVRNSRSRGQEDNDKEIENAVSKKRLRGEDKSPKTVDSASNSPPPSTDSLRSRKQSREQKALNNSVGSTSSKTGGSVLKLKESKQALRKSSLETSPKNKRQKLSKPDQASENDDVDSSDDDAVLSSLVDTPRPTRSRKIDPKPTSTPAKSKKLSKKNTEDNIPAEKRPVAKAINVASSRKSGSKRLLVKVKTVLEHKKDKTLQEAVPARTSKRKAPVSGTPEKSAGKRRKQEDEPENASDVESQSRRRAGKKLKSAASSPYTCGVCSKDFKSSALGKDHELQHDDRYNNFAVKLCRLDLTKSDVDQGNKNIGEAESDDEWPIVPKVVDADFDSLLGDETKKDSGSSLETQNPVPEEGQTHEETGNSESEPKESEPENLKPADSGIVLDSISEDDDKKEEAVEDNGDGKDEEEGKNEESAVNTEAESEDTADQNSKPKDPEEKNEEPEDTAEQEFTLEIESSALKESEQSSKPEEQSSKPEEQSSKSEEDPKTDVPSRELDSPVRELLAVLEDDSGESKVVSEDKESENPECVLSTNTDVVEEIASVEEIEFTAPSSPVLGKKPSPPESEDPGSNSDLTAEDKDVAESDRTGHDDSGAPGSEEVVRNGEGDGDGSDPTGSDPNGSDPTGSGDAGSSEN